MIKIKDKPLYKLHILRDHQIQKIQFSLRNVNRKKNKLIYFKVLLPSAFIKIQTWVEL